MPDPCSILGGQNGSGKSRLLRSFEEALGEKALYLDLHHLVEQSMLILRTRDDIEAMTEEFTSDGPDAKRQDHLHHVIRRNYESVEWFSLELELKSVEPVVADKFKWGGDQSVVPFFRARHRSRTYTSLEMGLGEYSVHLLFWILEQYRDVENLVLLLDEPDAFLPPVGVKGLLQRLISVCLDRDWTIVIATHSEEMIAHAVQQRAFVLVRTTTQGWDLQLVASDTTVADHLLTRTHIENMVFVEDESAWHLVRSAIEASSKALSRSTAITWGGGEGYLGPLIQSLPRPPAPEIRFAVAPDGDQRSKFKSRGKWPVSFMPTNLDPDDLFKSLANQHETLATRFIVDVADLERFLDTIEGEDAHDWVNRLGERYGRQIVLSALSKLWVEQNGSESEAFVEELQKAWKI